MLPIEVKTEHKAIHQVRIIPRHSHYVVEVIYSKEPVQAHVDPAFCVAIDLGMTNLAAITSNREGFIPRLVNGRTLKAMNQWYNKRMKELTLFQIPHAKFIDMLTYKAELVGIHVEVQEESYTSKASFLDLDPIPIYKPNDETEYTFSGKRFGRRNRLYRTKDEKIVCADVNGSYNILRKSKPDAFAHADAKGIAAYVVQPLRLAITV